MRKLPCVPCSIGETFFSLLHSDPDMTLPVAAIEALVSLLASQPSLTTVSETMDLLESAISTLKRVVPSPISLSAGTDLFQRYLVTSLNRVGSNSSGSDADEREASDFQAARARLLSNSRLFVARAREARQTIAGVAKCFVAPGTTVLTTGGSRVVEACLSASAEALRRTSRGVGFRVIHIRSTTGGAVPSNNASDNRSSQRIAHFVDTLRNCGVPVASVVPEAVLNVLESVDLVIAGAEVVTASGGVVSCLGTHQIAALARTAGKPVYMAAESHKFVRIFPLGQKDLGVDRSLLHFESRPQAAVGEKHIEDSGVATKQAWNETLDYTPPHLINALLTEHGVITPSAVSEELIKIWS